MKKSSKYNIVLTVVTVAEILLMLLSWFANFGPLRMTLTRMTAYPFFSAFLFAAANIISAKYRENAPVLGKLCAVSCLVYLPPHLLISERIGGEEYLFFGLVRTESIPAFIPVTGYVLLILSTAVVVAQAFFCVVARKRLRG